MDYVLNLVWLVLGFAFLIKGADFFVDGSSSIAKIMKIPTVIIGLTIVSIGTSLPEAAVSITASLQGNYDLSIANVVVKYFQPFGRCGCFRSDLSVLDRQNDYEARLPHLYRGNCNFGLYAPRQHSFSRRVNSFIRSFYSLYYPFGSICP